MARNKIIITTNREVYDKFNMLSFNTDIVLKNTTEKQITKILNNINKHEKVLTTEKIGDYLLIKKQKPINFLVYYRKKQY